MTSNIMLTEDFLQSAMHSEQQSLVLLSDTRELNNTLAEQYLQWLTEPERKRIAAIKDPTTALNSLLGRAAARFVAALWWHLSPREVKIVQHSSGKPELYNVRSPSLHFSITHHRHWVAVAFARVPIGVDIEYPSQTDRMKLAQRFFLTDEFEWLCTLPDSDRGRSFTRLWTLKEAEVKRIGSALVRVMGRVGFAFDNHRIQVKGSTSLASYGLHELAGGMLLALAQTTPTIASATFLQGLPKLGYQTISPLSLASSI